MIGNRASGVGFIDDSVSGGIGNVGGDSGCSSAGVLKIVVERWWTSDCGNSDSIDCVDDSCGEVTLATLVDV